MLGLVVTLAAFTLLAPPAFAQQAQSPPPQPAAGPDSPPADSSPGARGLPPQEPASIEGLFLQPIPESLPDAIEMALDRSPDVRLARIKLEQAECELDQARMKVAQEVARLFSERMRLGQGREILGKQVDTGIAEVHQLMDCEAQLAQADNQLRYLLGLAADAREARTPSPGAPMELVPGERPELPKESESIVANALSTPCSADFMQVPLAEIMDFLGDRLSVPFVTDTEVMGMKVQIKCQDATLKRVLLALTDHCPSLCFVVREYGIFATTKERARTINAPTIPAIPYWQERFPSPPPPLPPLADAPVQPEPAPAR